MVFLFLERFEGIPGEASDFSFIRIRNNALLAIKDFLISEDKKRKAGSRFRFPAFFNYFLINTTAIKYSLFSIYLQRELPSSPTPAIE